MYLHCRRLSTFHRGLVTTFLRGLVQEPPQYRGSAGPRQVSRTRVPSPRRIRPDGGRTPRRTMPDPRLMLLVCQTLMPDRGRTRPDAAPDAGRRPRAPAGLQPGLPAQGRFLGQGRAAPRTVVLGRVGGIHPSLLAGSRVGGGGGSPAPGGNYGRARPARIPRGTPKRAMQSFEYRSVRYWSKEINGTLTGGRKK